VIFPAVSLATQFSAPVLLTVIRYNIVSANGHKEIIRLVGIDAQEISKKEK
jgi:hypothetical protein